MRQRIRDPAQARRTVILVDRDVLHIAQAKPRLVQAIGDRLARETAAMLDPAEALFLRGGNQNPVAHQRRCGIAMKGVDAEDDHVMAPLCASARAEEGPDSRRDSTSS